MAKILSQSEQKAQKAEKDRKRNKLNGQIENVQNQINAYDNEISSLEFKLASQRAKKILFDGKCSDLDTEKAAKAVGVEISVQYMTNLNYALGYTEMMSDLLSGSTGQAYQNYQQETMQYMQMEIDENQARLEELQRVRSNSVAAADELEYQLARI